MQHTAKEQREDEEENTDIFCISFSSSFVRTQAGIYIWSLDT